MEKVRMVLRRTQVAGTQSTLKRAVNLAQTYRGIGDANLANTEIPETGSVTKAGYHAAWRKILVETNRSP